MEHQRALFAAGQGRNATAAANRFGSRLEAVGLVERADLTLVGEEHIHVAIHQLLKAVAMAVDTEGIGEGKGHLAAAGARHLGGGDEGALGGIAVPEIALEVEQMGLAHQIKIEVFGLEIHRGAQVGAHRALGIGGHQDQAAGRGGTVVRGGRVELGADGADVVAEDAPELVVAHAADEGGASSELGDAGERVGSGAAGGLEARAHARVEPLGLRLIHQGHRALAEAMVGEEGVIRLHQHVHDGVADADHIERLGGERHAGEREGTGKVRGPGGDNRGREGPVPGYGAVAACSRPLRG